MHSQHARLFSYGQKYLRFRGPVQYDSDIQKLISSSFPCFKLTSKEVMNVNVRVCIPNTVFNVNQWRYLSYQFY